MPVRQATVASRVGLHARPASLFVAEATKLGVPVTIQVGERPAVDARSMLAVMTLGAKCGDVVTLSSDAEGADAARQARAAMLALDPQWLRAARSDPSIIRGVAGLAGPYDFLPLEKGGRGDKAMGKVRPIEKTQPIHFARSDAPPFRLPRGVQPSSILRPEAARKNPNTTRSVRTGSACAMRARSASC